MTKTTPGKVGDIPLIIDERVPLNEAWIQNSKGEILAKIVDGQILLPKIKEERVL